MEAKNLRTMTKEQWEREIQNRHPIIRCFPREKWGAVAKFNGYLPLPPVQTSGPRSVKARKE